MNFKPNKWKVVVAIVFTLLAIYSYDMVIGGLMCDCVAWETPVCDYDYGSWIVKAPAYYNQCGGCIGFSQMFGSNIISIGFPFVLIYVVWSLFEKKK